MKKKKPAPRAIPYETYLLREIKHPEEMKAYLTAALAEEDLRVVKLVIENCIKALDEKG